MCEPLKRCKGSLSKPGKMHSAKEKVSNAAAAGKEHIDICKAKAQEKAEKVAARTKEDKTISHERRKAKEAEAKMKLHEAKAEHAAEKVHGKHLHHHEQVVGTHRHHHQPIGTAVPTTGVPAPTYPLGGQFPAGPSHNKHV
ncbi:Late embryogenesis abundant protein [Forsythia ovata]|uniref:Late embryogenesis abundant protein n=1 Tax=Forsythia ovata TaxID=205694 RepID=A0ABD1W6L4_9LAMI